MKKWVTAILVVASLALISGYYLGYDRGRESAWREIIDPDGGKAKVHRMSSGNYLVVIPREHR